MKLKQILGLTLCLLLTFALIGCGAPAETEPKSAAPAEKVSEAKVLPDYVGFTLEGATFYLENEFKVVRTPHAEQPEGNVYKTEPAAGEPIDADTVITFYVSTGPDGAEEESKSE